MTGTISVNIATQQAAFVRLLIIFSIPDAGYTTTVPGNGSVDSQDSLWQLKMAANGGPQYDQYGGHDDYAHFPQTQDPYAQVSANARLLQNLWTGDTKVLLNKVVVNI